MAVYGSGPLASALATAVRDVSPELAMRWVPWPAEPDVRTRAVIAAWEGDGARLWAAVRAAHADVPRLVVFPGRVSPANARRLYLEGATCVFEWAAEREQVPRALVVLLRVRPARSPARTGRPLVRAIDARLRAEGVAFGDRLRIAVLDGLAFVTGSVDTPWKKRLVEEVVASTPGVEGAVVNRLFVEGRQAEDADIAQATRTALRWSGEVDLSTVAVSVRSGCVVLTGTVRDGAEAQIAVESAARIRGVRQVEDRIVVSPLRRLREVSVAASVRQALRGRFPALRIDAAFYGGTAVLRGATPTLRDALAAASLAARQPGVRRVVNKLQVVRTII